MTNKPDLRCPNSPNCVSTTERSKQHAMAPLTYRLEEKALISLVVQAIESIPGGRIVGRSETTVSAEFRSSLFKFVDDVEFVAVPKTKELHFRSESRVGYWDMGANRSRMEALVRKLTEHPGVDVRSSR